MTSAGGALHTGGARCPSLSSPPVPPPPPRWSWSACAAGGTSSTAPCHTQAPQSLHAVRSGSVVPRPQSAQCFAGPARARPPRDLIRPCEFPIPRRHAAGSSVEGPAAQTSTLSANFSVRSGPALAALSGRQLVAFTRHAWTACGGQGPASSRAGRGGGTCAPCWRTRPGFACSSRECDGHEGLRVLLRRARQRRWPAMLRGLRPGVVQCSVPKRACTRFRRRNIAAAFDRATRCCAVQGARDMWERL